MKTGPTLMRLAAGLVVAAAVGAAGAAEPLRGPATASPGAPAAIEGPTWRLTDVRGFDAAALPAGPRSVTARFQGGRIDVGFLGAAQIDRHGNLNSTVIGDYDHPTVRLPGGGGAPEIATGVRDVFVMLRQNTRTFVEQLDFRSSSGERVAAVITDLGILEPDPETRELVLTHVHPGTTVDAAVEATGWALRVAETVAESAPPTDEELTALRSLRTTVEEEA